MSRISGVFADLKANQRTALIPFVTAGDPNPELTLELMNQLVASGADIIELGVPFSDPMADGPVIQRASERALEHGMSLRDVLALVKRFRAGNDSTPVVLMGYLNPIEIMGYETFAQAASAAGVDGVLTVDMPPEESSDGVRAFKAAGLDPIFLLSPTSNADRIGRIAAAASGFVYYVSLKGVTGAANLDLASIEQKLGEIRAQTDLPLGVGFGIKDAETAAQVGGIADAVVVGSAIVSRIEQNLGEPAKAVTEIGDLVSGMRRALDG